MLRFVNKTLFVLTAVVMLTTQLAYSVGPSAAKETISNTAKVPDEQAKTLPEASDTTVQTATSATSQISSLMYDLSAGLYIPDTAKFFSTLMAGFPVLENSLGDMNQDNIFNIWDLLRVRNIYLGLGNPPDQYELTEGDLNLNGIVNLDDVIILQDVLLHKIGLPYLIGASGGVVAQDNWKVTFPSGVLTEDVVVSIQSLQNHEVEHLMGSSIDELQSDSDRYFIKAFRLESSSDISDAQFDLRLIADSLPPCSFEGLNGIFEISRDLDGDGSQEITLLTQAYTTEDSLELATPAFVHNILTGTNVLESFYRTNNNSLDVTAAPGQFIEILCPTILTDYHPAYTVVFLGADGDSTFAKPIFTDDSSLVVVVPWLSPGSYEFCLHDMVSLDYSPQLDITILEVQEVANYEDLIEGFFSSLDSAAEYGSRAATILRDSLGLIDVANDILELVIHIESTVTPELRDNLDTVAVHNPGLYESFAGFLQYSEASSAYFEKPAGKDPGGDFCLGLRLEQKALEEMLEKIKALQRELSQKISYWESEKSKNELWLSECPPEDEECRQHYQDEIVVINWKLAALNASWLTIGASYYCNMAILSPILQAADLWGCCTLAQIEKGDCPCYDYDHWRCNRYCKEKSKIPEGHNKIEGICVNCVDHLENKCVIWAGRWSLGYNRRLEPHSITASSWNETTEDDLQVIYNQRPYSTGEGAIITPTNLTRPVIFNGIIDKSGSAYIACLPPDKEIVLSAYHPATGYYDEDVAHIVTNPVGVGGSSRYWLAYFNPNTTSHSLPIEFGFPEDDVIAEGSPRFEYWFTATENQIGDLVNFGFRSEEELTFWVQDPSENYIVKDSAVTCLNEWDVVLTGAGVYKITVTYGVYGGEGPFEVGVCQSPYAPTSYLCNDIAGVLQQHNSPYYCMDDLGVPYGDSLIAESNVKVIINTTTSIDDSGLIHLPHLNIQPGGILTHTRGLSTGVELTLDTLDIEFGGSIDVTAKGYRGAGRDGQSTTISETYPGYVGAGSGCGGSHGGYGGVSGAGGSPGNVYDIIEDPFAFGAGGGRRGGAAPNGGGLVKIEADLILLNGSILTNGGSSVADCGGAAGGTINLRVGHIDGSGTISADGSNGGPNSNWIVGYGGGGGGRVAIRWQSGDVSTWTVTAQGGARQSGSGPSTSGGAGTVYLLGPDDGVDGRLIVDNRGRDGVITPLMPERTQFKYVSVLNSAKFAMGSLVDTLTVLDSLLVSGTATQFTLLDSVVMTTPRLINRNNAVTSFGEGLVLDVPQIWVDGGASLITETNLSFVDATDFMLTAGGILDNRKTVTFTIPRFEADNMVSGTFKNWGQLVVLADSMVVGSGVTLEENGQLGITDSIGRMRIVGTLTHATRWNSLSYDDYIDTGLVFNAGELVIDSVGRIDVTAKGYRGAGRDGQSTNISETYPGYVGAGSGCGGSHGGYGGVSGAGGSPGDVYDIIEDPLVFGAGGGRRLNAAPNGGGLVQIGADQVYLDGSILANGGDPVTDCGGAAGGSINLRANHIEGSGTISTNGSNGGPNHQLIIGYGGGGGGRVAIRWQSGDISSWTITAQGGARQSGSGPSTSGGAGTVYLLGPDDGVDGRLIVDNRGRDGVITPLMPERTQFKYVSVLNSAKFAMGSLVDTLTVLDSLLVSGTATQFTLLDSVVMTTPRLINRNNAVTSFGEGLVLDVPQIWVDGGASLITETDLSFIDATDFMLTAGGILDNRKTVTFTIPRFETDNIMSGTFKNWGRLAVSSDSIVVDSGVTLEENGQLGVTDSIGRIRVIGTLTHSTRRNAMSYDDYIDTGLVFHAGDLVIESVGEIDVTAKGYRGAGRDGQSTNISETYPGYVGAGSGCGGSHGGFGGVSGAGGSPGNVYDIIEDPFALGAGGGARGSGPAPNGGGFVHIVTGNLELNGLIVSNGGSPTCDCGGGAGGAINLNVGQIGGSGTISANGSNGGPTCNWIVGYGGGGGGRLAIRWQSGSIAELTLMANGGAKSGGGTNGSPGTIYTEQITPSSRSERDEQ